MAEHNINLSPSEWHVMEFLWTHGPATGREATGHLEARMGCGFGACMGCTIETLNGPKRVCREGPVFRKEELLW